MMPEVLYGTLIASVLVICIVGLVHFLVQKVM